ncbi:hypothetical protein GGR02_002324 [Anoxybacillus voinovskiensis]|uniref:DUF4275 domain-containing protein n=1 Tax=Anoxybacteroides voinovskiense TaxID=230470 RepID=A0A840DVV0_9BACL|nr:DUF4275 family protein [Anoxybacillus voinovskiensis]MBB4074557.1 hypothetical protein [Anoxybacillus voinovskiensis]GGJ71185.1 ATP synthase F1 subunit delta [Anoxybacillus voinovskiensis]
MGWIEKLQAKGVIVKKIGKMGEQLRAQWERAFADHISQQEKASIYFDQFLWHVFSYKMLPCLEEREAVEIFNREQKEECLIFYQNDDRVYHLMNAQCLRAEDLQDEHDLYVIDPTFTWTYVQTHEWFCGPYFYRKGQRS